MCYICLLNIWPLTVTLTLSWNTGNMGSAHPLVEVNVSFKFEGNPSISKGVIERTRIGDGNTDGRTDATKQIQYSPPPHILWWGYNNVNMLFINKSIKSWWSLLYQNCITFVSSFNGKLVKTAERFSPLIHLNTNHLNSNLLTGLMSFMLSAKPILNIMAFRRGTIFLMEDIWNKGDISI